MLSLNKPGSVSAELTETGCVTASHYSADHLGDLDRKKCKREGLSEVVVGQTASRGKRV